MGKLIQNFTSVVIRRLENTKELFLKVNAFYSYQKALKFVFEFPSQTKFIQTEVIKYTRYCGNNQFLIHCTMVSHFSAHSEYKCEAL